MLVSARAPGLLILLPIALVVLEIHISNFVVYFFVHNNFCKKAAIVCFFTENISISKDSTSTNFSASLISCCENMRNFTLTESK
jgi:hypothetical protein